MRRQSKGQRRWRRKRDETAGAATFLIILLLLIGLLSLYGQRRFIHNALWLIALAAVVVVGGIGLLVVFRLRRRRRWLAHVQTLSDLLALTPSQFELAVGELLSSWGYLNVRHMGGSGDLAADLICRTADGQLVVVQCKRFAPRNSVGSPEVQKFIGMLNVHHKAQVGIFVTTSRFTHPALTLARQHGLRTIDGQELTQHIQQMRAQTANNRA